MDVRACHSNRHQQSLGCACRPRPCTSSHPLTPYLSHAGASSLTLVAEKQNAHSREVNSVAFSPDGKTIVSGSDDKSLKVWGALAALAPAHPAISSHPHASYRCFIPGFGRREAERAQQLGELHRLLSGRQDDRLGLVRQHPQSVGCACRPSPCTSSHQFTPSCLLQVLHPWLWSPRSRMRTAPM